MSFIYNRSQQICMQLPTPSTGEIIPIYEPSLVGNNETVTGLRYNGYLTDLRIRSVVSSLPETPLPEFELGESKTQKMATVRDLEYNSPRFGLEVLLAYEGSSYLPIFEFAMHNRQPFFVTEVLSYLTNQPALALAPDASLAVRFKDVGYGFPTGQDSFIVYGVAREEAIQPTMATGLSLSPKVISLSMGSGYAPFLSESYANRLIVFEEIKLALLDVSISSTRLPVSGDVVCSWNPVYANADLARVFIPLVSPVPPAGASTWLTVGGNTLSIVFSGSPPSTNLGYAIGQVAWRLP